MANVYYTAKRSNEEGLPYFSKIDGFENLHYDLGGLLITIAQGLVGKNLNDRVVLRNNISPLEIIDDLLYTQESRFNEVVSNLVRGHNLALSLGTVGDMEGSRRARSILNGTTKF